MCTAVIFLVAILLIFLEEVPRNTRLWWDTVG